LASEKLFGGGNLEARNPGRDCFILWHWRILSFLASSGEAAGVFFAREDAPFKDCSRSASRISSRESGK
jgi:hypothetical protein